MENSKIINLEFCVQARVANARVQGNCKKNQKMKKLILLPQYARVHKQPHKLDI